VAEPGGIEQRLTSLESRLEDVATDAAAARREAAAARYLAAAHDRDLADLGIKVDASRRAINALGQQTAARFDRLEAAMGAGFAAVDARFAAVDARFADVNATLGRTVAGQEQIVRLLDHVITRLNDARKTQPHTARSSTQRPR
jgi:hypothetical protein